MADGGEPLLGEIADRPAVEPAPLQRWMLNPAPSLSGRAGSGLAPCATNRLMTLAAAVDQRADGAAIDIVEPAADERNPENRDRPRRGDVSLPLNQGFTVCWSVETTSVR